ncbi:MAG TPA: response regulator, partial [Kofleriaceae bacterium]|nr:response regulator [Kofleriaceae bacterium]
MSKKILCADDSATMQMVAEITFRATEYEYVGARSADEALAKARESKPALILADAAMPGKDGYDLCEALKSDAALAGVPVVLMCGKSQAYDSQRGAKVGADDHVTKPWDTQVLIDKVGEILTKTSSSGVATAASAPATAAVPSPVDAPKPVAPVVAPVSPPPANPARS